MKKLITLILLCVVAVASASAARITTAYNKSFDITYQSVDVNNRPITLSAKVYYPTTSLLNLRYATVEFIVLNNHPTISHNDGAPTGSDPQLEAVKYMTSENAMVVCPDLIGFGKSASTIHPYMIADLTARNTLDCYMAAIADAKKRGIKFAKDYYTINIGYSQGGFDALAFHRYLDQQATTAEQNAVRLKGSLCGAGPYSQQAVFDEYEAMDCISYPAYLPYAIQGLKVAFADTHMRGVALQDCFTPEFWQLGIIDILNAKKTTIDDINNRILRAFGGKCSFYDVISADYADPSSAVHQAITAALAESNLLDGSWMPDKPITFFHYSKDEVVPPVETQLAMEAFDEASVLVQALSEKDYCISQNVLWDIAFSLGGYSREWNHRNGGVYFYLMFLAGNMRPGVTLTSTHSNWLFRAPEVPGATSIESIEAPAAPTGEAYDLSGRRVNRPTGTTILRMNDGTVRKVIR